MPAVEELVRRFGSVEEDHDDAALDAAQAYAFELTAENVRSLQALLFAGDAQFTSYAIPAARFSQYYPSFQEALASELVLM